MKTEIYKHKAKYVFFKDGFQVHLEVNFTNGTITILNEKDRIWYIKKEHCYPFIFKGSEPKTAKIIGELITEMGEFGEKLLKEDEKLNQKNLAEREKDEKKLTPKQKKIIKDALLLK